ncbi:hypothetical protein [Deferribacter abyssi]|uniref:hypothetical protein n=1 Tax=Deferribacter abyssi TaxID=213806 RepID=UPI003C1474C0
MATIITVIFSIKDRRFVKKYLKKEWGNFLTLYFTALVSLLVTFVLSVVLLFINNMSLAVFATASLISNVWQLFWIIVIILNLMRKE